MEPFTPEYSIETLNLLLDEANKYFQRLLERLNRMDSVAGMLLGLNGVVVTILITQRDFFSDKGYGHLSLYLLLASAAIYLISFFIYHAAYPSYPGALLGYEEEERIYTLRSILEDYHYASALNERNFWWKRIIVYLGLGVFITGITFLVITANRAYSGL